MIIDSVKRKKKIHAILNNILFGFWFELYLATFSYKLHTTILKVINTILLFYFSF
ncbi:hypothetical protein K501DRAFT_27583 [Backusella circina FSU 941]|nr:hypothetical protein K501DRAFT_27583 [Backusella circina FSU 941]